MGTRRAPTTAAERSRKFRRSRTPGWRTRDRAVRAQRRRVDLVRLLSPGGICSRCLRRFHPSELTIHHVDGRGWNASRMSQHGRVARYWREYRAGVRLAALCGRCNSSVGSPTSPDGVVWDY